MKKLTEKQFKALAQQDAERIINVTDLSEITVEEYGPFCSKLIKASLTLKGYHAFKFNGVNTYFQWSHND